MELMLDIFRGILFRVTVHLFSAMGLSMIFVATTQNKYFIGEEKLLIEEWFIIYCTVLFISFFRWIRKSLDKSVEL